MKGPMILFMAVGLLAQAILYGTIAYIALHFIAKVW